jgi:hypothetical protein
MKTLIDLGPFHMSFGYLGRFFSLIFSANSIQHSGGTPNCGAFQPIHSCAVHHTIFFKTFRKHTSEKSILITAAASLREIPPKSQY